MADIQLPGSSEPQSEGSDTAPNAEAGTDDAPISITKAELTRLIAESTNAAITQRLRAFESKLDKRLPEPVKTAPSSESNPLDERLRQLEAREQASLAKELRTSVADNLRAVGVSEHYIKPLLAQFVDSERTVTRDDAGEIIYRLPDGDIPLSSGVKLWAKSEAAKPFIAAPLIKGSGDKAAKSHADTSPGKSVTDFDNKILAHFNSR
jgi:hypothetical protein